jgi:hypothetical protein
MRHTGEYGQRRILKTGNRFGSDEKLAQSIATISGRLKSVSQTTCCQILRSTKSQRFAAADFFARSVVEQMQHVAFVQRRALTVVINFAS